MDRRGSKKNDPATDYAYNAAGRMESVDHHAGGTAAYTYDAFGRKRSIVEAGSTTRLFYGPAGTLLEESDATGTPGRGYLRVAGRPLAAVTAAGDLQWVLSDQVGQPQKLLDASAALLWDRIAHPFGDTYAQVTGMETDEPQRFPGQRFEQLTGLHYNYFRDYDPSLGRYIQADPTGLRGGLNIYLYAKANPYKYIDPTGEVAIADDAAVALLLLAAGACVATDCVNTIIEILGYCYEGAMNLIALMSGSSESDDDEDPKTPLDEDEHVDLTDPRGREHILDGDATGGGHRHGTGNPGKSEFPEDWSDDKVIGEISDIATDPNADSRVQSNGRRATTGERDGVEIKVIQEENGRIVTGFPTNQPRNPRN